MDGNSERLLTPGEVAALFRVDPKTVTRWAASGRISSIRTPGGHRRFRESEVRALLGGDARPAADDHSVLLGVGTVGRDRTAVGGRAGRIAGRLTHLRRPPVPLRDHVRCAPGNRGTPAAGAHHPPATCGG